MKIQIDRIDEHYHFAARNETGNTVSMDASFKAGGHQLGARPMELVAMGLAGCSSIDVLSILYKQKQQITTYGVEVDAQRADEIPAVFTNIHLLFRMEGKIEPDKVRRAIELSLDKYCSVSRMLEKTAVISYSFVINGQEYDGRE